jgi:hypothetical protein
MQDQPVDLNTFATALMEAANRTVLQSMEGLTDEQVYYRPSDDTNSIGWLAWHLSRWMDRFGALALDEPQVWISQGWADRFGFEPERTGMGDTPERVAAFRPARELLVGYVEAAHADNRVTLAPYSRRP